LGVFLSIAISFYYYATKQEGERRLMGFLAGTAALFAVMIRVTNLFAFIFGNPVLEASVWICAAAAFILMYFALLPPEASNIRIETAISKNGAAKSSRLLLFFKHDEM